MKPSLDTMEAKTVFLSQEERQSLALERHQDAVTDQIRSTLDIFPSLPRPAPPPFNPPRDSSSPHREVSDEDQDRDKERDGDLDRDRDRDDDDGSRRDRDRNRDSDREEPSRRDCDRDHDRDREHRDRERGDRDKVSEKDRLEKMAEREKEPEAINKQCLGSKKPKKRVIKPSVKFRVSSNGVLVVANRL